MLKRRRSQTFWQFHFLFRRFIRFGFRATHRTVAIWLACMRPDFAWLATLTAFSRCNPPPLPAFDPAIFQLARPPFSDFGFLLFDCRQNFGERHFARTRLNQPIAFCVVFPSIGWLAIHQTLARKQRRHGCHPRAVCQPATAPTESKFVRVFRQMFAADMMP